MLTDTLLHLRWSETVCNSAVAALGKPVESYLESLHQYFKFCNLDPTSWHLHKHLQGMLGSSSTKGWDVLISKLCFKKILHLNIL